MVKSSQIIESEFLANLSKESGKTLESWMKIIKDSGFKNRNEILDWLKSMYDFGHVNASLLAGVYMNNGNPVYQNETGLLTDQFVKKEHLKPLYGHLMQTVLEKIPETHIEIKKTYTSLNAKREFAAIGIKSKEIRLAMDLNGEPDGVLFHKTTGIGCMPRISHMVKIVGESQINNDLINNLKTAYERLNK